jgi:hypothetical protein
LNPGKLTDTIRQIALAEESPPALICDTPDRDHGWVYLAVSRDTPGEWVWLLTMGYPSIIDPSFALKDLSPLSDEITVIEWEAGIHARLSIPSSASYAEVAQLLTNIMTVIQNIRTDQTIEVALEYT